MRRYLLLLAFASISKASAQNTTVGNIIEGGKVLVDLVRVLKIPKTSLVVQPVPERKDSCFMKNQSDLCFRNATGKSILVTLYKRSGNGYEPGVLSARILPRNQECWYELKAGVYKMKVERDDDDSVKIYREGELKLLACSNLFREIKDE